MCLRRRLQCLLGLWILCFATASYGILDIEITRAVDAAIPLVIAPFTFKGQTPPKTELASVIRSDLLNSGEFKRRRSPLYKRRLTLETLPLSSFKQAGIDYIVLGSVTEISPNRYQVSFHLVDAYQKQEVALPSQAKSILSKEFVVEGKLIRQLAHHISDKIYEKITGVRGAFSTQIAYVTTRWQGGKPKRFVLNIADADGYNPRPILTSPEPIMSPSWSPNGRQIAYVSFENKRAEVYVSDVVSGARKLVSRFPGINGAPAWSPDGKQLALVLSRENTPKIYTLNLQNGDLRKITSGWSIDTEPRWSPDGESIVFTSNRGGKPQIYEINLATSKIKRLTFEGNYNARATLSPDKRNMVLIHRNSRGKFQIAVQDMKTYQIRILTNTRLDESPSLSPNGRMVIYGTMRNGRRLLAAVSVDGRVKLSLPSTDGDVQEPAWSPFLS